MLNPSLSFWLALLRVSDDVDKRKRLWNGYLGWKLPSDVKKKSDSKHVRTQLIVESPTGGWPELTEEELSLLETLAQTYDGHPKFDHEYMNFSGHTFSHNLDLSGLIFVRGNFTGARFTGELQFSNETQFFGHTWFDSSIFYEGLNCHGAQFHSRVSFAGSKFLGRTNFYGALFIAGASFANTMFQTSAMFSESRFEERDYSVNISSLILADFTNAKFPKGALFREVQFGNDEKAYSRGVWPERRADFSGAEFGSATTFRGALFAGAPAFFNTTLHEDTDFGRIDWRKAENRGIYVDYTIRAWERLELIMSKLEKPLDRHRFFRLKMRARRRADSYLLRILNWLFETTCDYGWGVGRAFGIWLGHWLISGLILFVNSGTGALSTEWSSLVFAALGTAFANAHAFLSLSTEGGYLNAGRVLLEKHDQYGVLTPLGTMEASLGPIFLFLVLLTLRNRFRLA